MPELPDLTVYLEAMAPRILGEPLDAVRLINPFVLRSVDPPLSEASGRRVTSLRRLGKRLIIALGEPAGLTSDPSFRSGQALGSLASLGAGSRTSEDALFLVIHLMIAGRLRWRPPGKTVPRTLALAYFDFPHGSLVLTEAGKKRRASLHVVRGAASLAQFDRGGLEVFEASLAQFTARLRSENHTVKRALADPRLFSGIGNAYSDEILHRARLSPLTLTSRLSDEEFIRLFAATRDVLQEWTDRLRTEAAGEFPEKVTAFREGMAVHGRFRKPCPVCGTPVQRIRYADNETNYCARCQTGGRLLADRALSRLLKQDWPRSIDEE
jgi:formamidopyrimidine-DNA glycosylase